jgi:hypothetical protein
VAPTKGGSPTAQVPISSTVGRLIEEFVTSQLVVHLSLGIEGSTLLALRAQPACLPQDAAP